MKLLSHLVTLSGLLFYHVSAGREWDVNALPAASQMSGLELAASSSAEDSNVTIVQVTVAAASQEVGASTVSASVPSTIQPHIVMLLFDDLGYHDLGEFSREKRHLCKTPVMNGLMNGGIKLTSFYVQPICSPTRAALMTGRYPIRYGGHVGTTPSLAGDSFGWAPGETFLPEKLQEAGYTTKMSGKWHLGRGTHMVTPTGKGFVEAYSKYEGGGDHWTHTVSLQGTDESGALWPTHPDYVAIDGAVDLHHDYWLGGELIHKHILDQNGTHSSDVIAREAARMIAEHDPRTSPLFLYVPFQAPHWPVQNPGGTEERHMDIPNKQRRKWCGLVSHIDDNVGRIVAALEANQGMLDNTVIFAFSDNGGDIRTGASNHPYRGDKMTVFEGGTKTAAFVYSPNEKFIPESRRGSTSDALGHVTDLFPTFLDLADGTLGENKPLDGVDLWSAWTGGDGQTSPRKEMLYNIDPQGLLKVAGGFMTGSGFRSEAELQTSVESDDPLKSFRQMVNGNTPENVGAIRVGNWKLIDGHTGRGDWYGTDPSLAWEADYIMGPDATNYELLQSGGPSGDMKLGDGGQGAFFFSDSDDGFKQSLLKMVFLFDLSKDPTEQVDVSAQYPAKVAELRERLAHYRKDMVPDLLTEHNRWSQEKKRAYVKQQKTGLRSIPGYSHKICDWWDEGYPEGKVPGGALSKL